MNQELTDIMDEFFSTTQYQGEVGDWNTTDETYEDPDEETEEFSTTTIIRRYGGPGSGHHGHAGRPGAVGGSGVGGGVLPFMMILYRGEGKLDKLDNFVTDPGDFGRGRYWTNIPAIAEGYGSGKKIRREMVRLNNPIYLSVKEAYKLADDMYGTVRGEREAGGGVGKASARLVAAEKLTRDLWDKGYDGMVVAHDKNRLEVVDYRPFMESKSKTEEFSTTTIVRRYGGPGSGFHGHAGRPGEVGGSGAGGMKDRGHISLLTKVGVSSKLSRVEQIEEDYKAAGIQITREHAIDIAETIENYVDGDYVLIRDYQLGRSKSGLGEKGSKLIEEYISTVPSFPKDIPIYRGMPKKREVFEQMNPGDIWDTKAISSWTSEKAVAVHFSGKKDRVVVKLQKGTSYSCSIRHLSVVIQENEVLLSGKNKLRFVSRKEVAQTAADGIVDRYLEVTMEYAGV